jgi:hypothetical protein
MLDSPHFIFYKLPRTNGHGLPKAAVPKDAQVAQLVEQRTENPRVGGSNPPLGTIILPCKINVLA